MNQRLLAAARTIGTIETTPAVEDLYFYVNADGRPHHVGIVTMSCATGASLAPGTLIVLAARWKSTTTGGTWPVR